LFQEIEGVDEARLKKLLPLLAELRAELDAVIPDAKAELGAAKQSELTVLRANAECSPPRMLGRGPTTEGGQSTFVHGPSANGSS
jgi:hypothetical protein